METEPRKIPLSEEPTEEQLEFAMNEVAKEARRSTARAKAEHGRRLKEIADGIDAEIAARNAKSGAT